MKVSCETTLGMVKLKLFYYQLFDWKMCIFLIHGDVTLVLIEDLVFKLAIYKDGTSKRLFIFKFFI